MMRCPYCLREVENSQSCSFCQGDLSVQNLDHQLPVGAMLAGRYWIGKVLGQGGFGITYAAMDTRLQMKVAIKEFFPSGVVSRISAYSLSVNASQEREKGTFSHLKQRFIEEARKLGQFSGNKNIVDVHDVFEDNGTAYMVMEFVEGRTLAVYRKSSFDEIIEILRPIMEALREIHEAGIIHRDISPQNIMITDTGRSVLIDFGAARDFQGQSSMSVIIKPGYSPIEQQGGFGKQGAWTDIYALSATIYDLLTGTIPQNSSLRSVRDELERPSELGAVITPEEEAVLMCGMAVKPLDRFQTMEEFAAAVRQAQTGILTERAKPFAVKKTAGAAGGSLPQTRRITEEDGEFQINEIPDPGPTEKPPVEKKKGSRGRIAAGMAGIAAILLAVFAGFLWDRTTPGTRVALKETGADGTTEERETVQGEISETVPEDIPEDILEVISDIPDIPEDILEDIPDIPEDIPVEIPEKSQESPVLTASLSETEVFLYQTAVLTAALDGTSITPADADVAAKPGSENMVRIAETDEGWSVRGWVPGDCRLLITCGELETEATLHILPVEPTICTEETGLYVGDSLSVPLEAAGTPLMPNAKGSVFASSDESVLLAEEDEKTLKLTGVSPGTAELSVSLYGLETVRSFTVWPLYEMEDSDAAQLYAAGEAVVREGPDASFEQVGTLSAGDAAQLKGRVTSYRGQAADWYAVAWEEGTGFVESTLLTDEVPSAEDDLAITELCRLGDMYVTGNGAAVDYEKAAGYYQQAADAGSARGQCSLAGLYYYGYGVPKDYGMSVYYFQLSAYQGYARGQHGLAIMYEEGYGVDKDISMAVYYYQLASAQGYADATAALKRLGAAQE